MTDTRDARRGAAKKRERIRPGDLFSIPLEAKGFGVCQVVITNGVMFVLIFKGPLTALDEFQSRRALREDPVLVGWTVDALIYHGRWQRIGTAPIDWSRVPLPSYQVLIDGVPCVVDTDGRRSRPATEEEIAKLSHRTTVAPIRFENALRAIHGLEPWRPEYDELTREHAVEAARVRV